MGLHIHIVTDNYHEVYSTEFFKNEPEYRSKMHLSKDFAELMARLNVSFGMSELMQVESISEVKLSAIWDMATFHGEEGNTLDHNINPVIETVDRLIEKLNTVENLQTKIEPYDDDIDLEFYFSDFSRDIVNGTSDNNFGQDLRNFKRFLEYALSKGASKVWFNIE